MQEDMVAWQSSYHDAEREYEEMAEDALHEVPLPSPAVMPTETTPLAASTSQIQNPVMQPLFTVPEERQVHPQAQDNVMDAQMDRDLNARWQKLAALLTTTIPSSSSRPDVLSTTQAKIPEFFDFIGSSSQPVVSSFSIPIIPERTPENVEKGFRERDVRFQKEMEAKFKEAGDNRCSAWALVLHRIGQCSAVGTRNR